MNRLQRCYVDGTDCQTIVQGYKYYIVDITIDFNTDRYDVHVIENDIIAKLT